MITSGNVPVFSTYRFTTGYGFLLMRQITEPFYGSHCRKLWSLRSCSPSRSSTSSSWCRGRFPWSCCSADHRYSPVAVLERGDRCPCCAKSFTCPLCATTGALVCVAHQQGRLHRVVLQRLISMVLFVQIIIEIHQLLDAAADVPVVRVVQVLMGAVVEETVELPRLHLLRNSWSGAAHHRVDELTG